jgi:ketosteroid isomerase-like protein
MSVPRRPDRLALDNGQFEGTRMTLTSKADLIRALFADYRAGDRDKVEAAMSDDFRFTSPYDDRIDKATYFVKCSRSTDWIASQELERIVVDGDQAFVTYQCRSKDGKSFRNTEFFVFADNKVRSIDVYFGATYQDGAFVPQER